MALSRLDSCRHFMDTTGEPAVFVKCLMRYSGSYSGRDIGWEVVINASDMPEGQQANPTDAQVQVVADPLAQAMYTAWTAGIDADKIAESAHSGQAATIVE